MRPRCLLLATAALIQGSCSSLERHPMYLISLRAIPTRTACVAVSKEVERFALASGYHRVRVSGRGDYLAVFAKGDFSIELLHPAELCWIRVAKKYSDDPAALAERDRLCAALRSRGLDARLEKDSDFYEV